MTLRDRAGRRTAAALALAAAIAGPGLAGAATAAPQRAALAPRIVGDCGSGCLNAYEARLGWLINDTRIHHGLRPLHVTPGTTDIARGWTWWMATHGRLVHNPRVVAAVSGAGSPQWQHVGENIGEGPGNADVVFAAYMASPHHRDNILAPWATHVGVGAIFRGGVVWDTTDFVDSYDVHYGPCRTPFARL